MPPTPVWVPFGRTLAESNSLRTLIAFLIATCLSAALAEAGVQLAWDPSPESNIAGYRLSYGTASRQYTTTIDVGNVTTFDFFEPNPSVKYFLAIRAYDTDGLVSSYSNEISTAPATPSLRVTGISSSHTSPQVTGTNITFSAIATGGTAPVQFKWWIMNGPSAQVGQTWSTNASFTWTPLAAGSYTIGVWARNAGSTADAPASSEAAMGMPIVINSLERGTNGERRTRSDHHAASDRQSPGLGVR